MLKTAKKSKPRIRYGILDGFGEVVRWSWNKPSKNYKFIIERIKDKPAIDFAGMESAPF